ncbi:putative baseplate assembly protein [Rhizobium terrae]|uniref:putative baseplate assembly protein n=1 Tax=Rhizobium terrae TaxID=2171756 RepID=UPI000E3DD43E|nr:putative baseplate assembly protein [Rhizobium terrae]
MSENCHGREITGPCDAPDLAPKRPDNRAGLSAIGYRIGRHGDFLARALQALPREIVEDRGSGITTVPLQALTVRTTEDPTIALIDSFAATLDVLAFYQERIANEGYVRTATERLSLVELMRAIDYELKPGVAASARVAFTVESSDDPFRVVEIPSGTQAMSVPTQPQDRPQIFETVEPIEARAEWNAIPARTRRPQNLALYWNAADAADGHNGELYLLDLDNSFDLADVDPDDIIDILDPAGAEPFLPLSSDIDIPAILDDLAEDALLNPDIEVIVKALRIDHAQVDGLGLALQQGGRMIAVGVRRDADGDIAGVRAQPFRIDGVEEDRAYGLTKVQLGAIEAAPAKPRRLKLRLRNPILRIGAPLVQPIAFNAFNASRLIGRAAWSGATLSAFVRTQAWPRIKIMRFFRQPPSVHVPKVGEPNPGLYLLRQSVAAFGATAPRHDTLAKPDETRGGTGSDPYGTDWDNAGPDGGPISIWTTSQGVGLSNAHLYLEREVTEAAPEGWVLLETVKGVTRAMRVARAATEARADYALSGKVTGLTVVEPNGDAPGIWGGPGGVMAPEFKPFNFRETSVKLASQPLTLGGLPILEDLMEGDTDLTLDGLYLDLDPGRAVAVAGERADVPGVDEDETCILKDIVHVGGYTKLTFSSALGFSYKRASVTVNANVALATHGETKSEVLGSGDATRANQAFKLSKPPLTFVTADSDSGVRTTLQVRVDGILWSEVPSLYDAGPTDAVYAVRIDDDGTTRIVFGDGRHGRRLPTGALNVAATYRTGMGREGQVEADTLTLLKTRPLGVRAVTNPSAASGVADAETLPEARERGPQSVRTLGRIVSLADYEDFARAFAGIGKAKVTAIWRGRRQIVHVTVAPAIEGVFDADDASLASLVTSMERYRDPRQMLIVAPHVPLYFKIVAKVAFDPRYLADDVRAAIEAALKTVFGYDARPLAEPMSAAAIIAAIQAVEGVSHVDLDGFGLYSENDPDAVPVLETVLPAWPARLSDGASAADPLAAVEPAQLLTIFTSGIALTMEAADA